MQILAGTPQRVDAPRDDGSTQRIFRCPQCQVASFSEYGPPEVRFVRAGTLDDPTDITPDVHIYTRAKVDWLTLRKRTPAFEAYYDHRKLWRRTASAASTPFLPARNHRRIGRHGHLFRAFELVDRPRGALELRGTCNPILKHAGGEGRADYVQDVDAFIACCTEDARAVSQSSWRTRGSS